MAPAMFVALALLATSADAAAKRWTGDFGDWTTAGAWDPRGVPAAGDSVLVSGLSNETLRLNATAAVASLELRGGATLELGDGVILTVGLLTWEGSVVSGGTLLVQTRGAFNVSGDAEATVSTRLVVSPAARFDWNSGDVFVGGGGNVSVGGSLVASADGGRLGPSKAFFGFSKTAGAVLNVELDAAAMFPRGNAIDDVWSQNSVLAYVADGRYALDPETSEGARSMYARSGLGGVVRYSANSTLALEACAEACDAAPWCVGFSHRSGLDDCALTQLTLKSAAGTTSVEEWDHYEALSSTANADRQGGVLGAVRYDAVVHVDGGTLSFARNTRIAVDVRVGASVDSVIDVEGNVTFTGGMNASGLVRIGPGALLTLQGRDFALGETARIEANETETLARINVLRGASLNLGAMPVVGAAGSLDVFVDADSSLESSAATLELRLGAFGGLTLSGAFDGGNVSVFARSLSIDGSLLADALRVNVSTARINGSVRVLDRGATYQGAARGVETVLGGGGGAHGGCGGGATASATAPAAVLGGAPGYGCAYWPQTVGAPGVGFYTLGFGGGHVSITAANLTVNGLVSADGANGADLDAAGGGAGGSMILQVGLLDGAGAVSANGGAGGFPGGWLGGGGGGGGRIVVVVDVVAETFSGAVTARGGTQAAAGTRSGGAAGGGSVLIVVEGYVFASFDSGLEDAARLGAPLEACDSAHITVSSTDATREALLDAAANRVDALRVAGGARVTSSNSLALLQRRPQPLAVRALLKLDTISTAVLSGADDFESDSPGGLEVLNGSLVLPSNASLAFTRLVLHTARATLQVSNLTVTDSAVLDLKGGGVVELPAAKWSLINGGRLEQSSKDEAVDEDVSEDGGGDAVSSVNVTLRVLEMDGATISISTNASILAETMDFVDSNFKGMMTSYASLEAMPNLFLRASASTVRGVVASAVNLVNLANMTLESSLTFATTAHLLNRGAVTLAGFNDEDFTLSVASLAATGLNSTANEESLFSNSGTVRVAEKTRATVHARFTTDASLDIEGFLTLKGGAAFEKPSSSKIQGTLDVAAAAACAHKACVVRFDAAAQVLGGGTLSVSGDGFVSSLPALVEARPAGVLLLLEGRGLVTVQGVELGEVQILGSSILDAGTDASEAFVEGTVLRNVSLEGGTLVARQGVRLAGVCKISGGALEVEGNATVVDRLRWSGGDITGGGTLSVYDGLDLIGGNPLDIATESGQTDSACPRLLGSTTLRLFGPANRWANGGSVVVSQASVFDVQGSFNVSGSSEARLRPGGPLMNFTRHASTSIDFGAEFDVGPPPLELFGTTASECAAYCGANALSVALGHSVARRTVVDMGVEFTCAGFDFEYVEMRCSLYVLNRTLFAAGEPSEADNDDAKQGGRWYDPTFFYYKKVAAWLADPVFKVALNATVFASTSFTVDVGAALDGAVVVDDTRVAVNGGGYARRLDLSTTAVFSVGSSAEGAGGSLAILAEGGGYLRAKHGAQLRVEAGSHALGTLGEDTKDLALIVLGGATATLEGNVHVLSVNASARSTISLAANAELNVTTAVAVVEAAFLVFDTDGRLHAANVSVRGNGSALTGKRLQLNGFEGQNLTLDVLDGAALSDSDSLTVHCGSLTAGGSVSASTVDINCGSIDVLSTGRVGADGAAPLVKAKGGDAPDPVAPGEADGGGGGGGGHGGSGAPGANGAFGGAAFGAADAGATHGGHGAPFDRGGGFGGGVVLFSASTVRVDGLVSARGADGAGNFGGGGGAGGGVNIRAFTEMSGNGAISVSGGAGGRGANYIAGGGGGGGRIACVVGTGGRGLFAFRGNFSTVGGAGYDGDSGAVTTAMINATSFDDLFATGAGYYAADAAPAASGTLFVELRNVEVSTLVQGALGVSLRRLVAARGNDVVVVDNGGGRPRVGLAASIGALRRRGVGVIAVDGGGVALVDSGEPFHVGGIITTDTTAKQIFVTNSTTLTLNSTLFEIQGAGLDVVIDETSALTPAHTVAVLDGAALSLAVGATCGSAGEVASKKVCRFENVVIGDRGTLRLQRPAGLVNSDEAWTEVFVRSNLTVEATGKVSATGAGHRGGMPQGIWKSSEASEAFANSTGAGGNSGGRYGGAAGSGGGHGGGGGDARDSTRKGGGAETRGINFGGEARGDSAAANPTALGGGGGASLHGAGGAGGGNVRLVVGGSLTLNGLIVADGADGTQGGGGGGGGSVWVSVVNGSCLGAGVLSASGGRGSSSYYRSSPYATGGDGGGGRVAFECLTRSSQTWVLSALAGGKVASTASTLEIASTAFVGTAGATHVYGAPGTIVTFIANETSLYVGSANATFTGTDEDAVETVARTVVSDFYANASDSSATVDDASFAFRDPVISLLRMGVAPCYLAFTRFSGNVQSIEATSESTHRCFVSLENASDVHVTGSGIGAGVDLRLVDAEVTFHRTNFTVQRNASLSLYPTARTHGRALGTYALTDVFVDGEVQFVATARSNNSDVVLEARKLRINGAVHADGLGGGGARHPDDAGGGARPGVTIARAKIRYGVPFGTGGSHASAYGSALSPRAAGSGGGAADAYIAGGNGGGVVRLNISENLVVDGRVSATGGRGINGSGGGAGGSVYVVSGDIAMNGFMDVSGGAGYPGGGDGGRVAVYYDTAVGDDLIDNYASAIRAAAGAETAAPGTVYVSKAGAATLYVPASFGDETTFAAVDDETALDAIDAEGGLRLLQNASVLHLKGSGEIRTKAALRVRGALNLTGLVLRIADLLSLDAPHILLDGGAMLEIAHGGRLSRADCNVAVGRASELALDVLGGDSGVYGFEYLNLTESSTCTVSTAAQTESSITLNLGSLLVDATSRIVGDGRGAAGGSSVALGAGGGTGGGSRFGGGGGHGGFGGDSVHSATRADQGYGGRTRGSAAAPLGGGGGGGGAYGEGRGGAGGAGLKIIARGGAVVDGFISCGGGNATAGGAGAGGSVWFVAATVRGGGLVAVDGGSTAVGDGYDDSGGAGAGGRILVEADCVEPACGLRYSARGGAMRVDADRYAETLFRESSDRGIFAPKLDRFTNETAETFVGFAAPGTVVLGRDELRVDGGISTTVVTQTSLGSSVAVLRLIVAEGCDLFVDASSSLNTSNATGGGLITIDGLLYILDGQALSIADGTSITARGVASVNGTVLLDGGAVLRLTETASWRVGSLTVENGARLEGRALHLIANDTVTIGNGSSINADGLGGRPLAPGTFLTAESLSTDDDYDAYAQPEAASDGLGESGDYGGSGGGSGGRGEPGLGLRYLEVLLDVAQHNLTTKVLFDADSDLAIGAQSLAANLAPATQVAAATVLRDAAPPSWTLSLEKGRDLAVALETDAFFKVTGAAVYAALYAGGSLLANYSTTGGGHSALDSGADLSYLSSADETYLRALTSGGGGLAYGSFLEPTRWGGAGGGAAGGAAGGAGGGALRVTARHLRLDGSISSDGAAGFDGGGGGGAGGSVLLEVSGTLEGRGVVRADGGGGGTDGSGWAFGGAGGGGRVSAAAGGAAAVDAWLGTSSARAGLDLNATRAQDPRLLGSVAWLNHSLVRNASVSTASATGALAAGDVLDVDFSVSRRGPVQVINSTGTGLGTFGSGDAHGGVVRGVWRLRFGASAWSDVLPVYATAADVHAQLDALQTCGAVGVDRNADGGGGYAWSVTFYEAATATWPLLGVDVAEVYSTNDDAAFSVERRSDAGAVSIDSPQAYADAAALADVLAVEGLGREHHAFWASPSQLRVVVDDPSDAASAAAVKAGNGVAATLRAPLANASAAFFPTASAPTVAAWSRR
ncbi:hypothetical protein M885DRAFT_336019 [Pelagophyceae sp. CCMP2097]|nr:hypothetical protein M885DRAFT_336019 [Pelagophyceae sp. CCMP2097]